MGHERLGLLPKTRRWRDIVSSMPSYAAGASSVDIAAETLKATGKKFLELTTDKNVVLAYQHLVEIAARDLAPDAPADATPFSIVQELNKRLVQSGASGESYELARRAAADAISVWFKPEGTSDLFSKIPPKRNRITNAGDYSEISRLFFARVVERSLKYFLEREASSNARSVAERDAFSARLRADLESASDAIRRHSHETASITQSYSAGWFQKYLKGQKRTYPELQKFVSYSLHKLREELKREAST